MSDEVLEHGDHEVDLVAGSGGVFDVTVEGRLVFSKTSNHRFPDPGEIAGLLSVE